jgi:hypothetical protein
MKSHQNHSSICPGSFLPSLMMIFHLFSLVFFSLASQALDSNSYNETSISQGSRKQVSSAYIEIVEEEINEDDPENDLHSRRKQNIHFKSNGLCFLVLNQYFQIQKCNLQSFPVRALNAPSGMDSLILYHQFKIDL